MEFIVAPKSRAVCPGAAMSDRRSLVQGCRSDRNAAVSLNRCRCGVNREARVTSLSCGDEHDVFLHLALGERAPHATWRARGFLCQWQDRLCVLERS